MLAGVLGLLRFVSSSPAVAVPTAGTAGTQSAARRRLASTPAGMVQHGSLTFRIQRVTRSSYGIVRILDDRFLGTFSCGQTLSVEPEAGIDGAYLLGIARIAVRACRTDWFRRAS